MRADTHFLLSILGTDTFYNEKHGEAFYPDTGEVLSHVADLIPDTESKVVIDGPLTMGHEVGDRIGEALCCALEAMATGKRDFHIIAHSRGAIESILLGWELYYIQQLINENNLSYDSVVNINRLIERGQVDGISRPTKCLKPGTDYTTQYAIENKYKARLQKAIHTLQGQQFEFSVNSARLIDPVPGGNFRGVPVGWQDPRMYRLSPIFKDVTVFVKKDERTRCFKVVVPKTQSAETQYQIQILRGNHGTASGNPFSQRKYFELPQEAARAVYTVAFANMLNDLLAVQLINPQQLSLKDNCSGTQLMTQYCQSTPEDREKQLLEAYRTITIHKDKFRELRRDNYGLGAEFHDLKSGSETTSRYVHYGAHNNDAVVNLPGADCAEEYVNPQHAALEAKALLRSFGIDNFVQLWNTDLVQSIDTFSDCVRALLETFTSSKKLPQDPLASAELALSAAAEHIVSLFVQHHQNVDATREALNSVFDLFNTLTPPQDSIAEAGDLVSFCHELKTQIFTMITERLHARGERTQLLIDRSNVINIIEPSIDLADHTSQLCNALASITAVLQWLGELAVHANIPDETRTQLAIVFRRLGQQQTDIMQFIDQNFEMIAESIDSYEELLETARPHSDESELRRSQSDIRAPFDKTELMTAITKAAPLKAVRAMQATQRCNRNLQGEVTAVKMDKGETEADLRRQIDDLQRRLRAEQNEHKRTKSRLQASETMKSESYTTSGSDFGPNFF